MSDDGTEEWPETTEATGRVIRMRGRIASVRPGYACAADIPPEPLHMPPDGHEWAVILPKRSVK